MQGEGGAGKRHHQPSGLHRNLELLIDPDWLPEQAPAVVDLLPAQLRQSVRARRDRSPR